MYQSEYIQKKIELICSVLPEEEHYFTMSQLDLVNFLKSGLLPSEIAKNRGLGTPSVYGQMTRCAEKITAFRSPDGPVARKRAITPQGENTRKNIDLLCSIPDPEHGETRFTPHQAEMINFLKAGFTPMEIAQKWGTSVRNVYNQILTCVTKIHTCAAKADPPPATVTPKPRKGRYQQFADADLSVLRKREREILSFRIGHPDLSLQQIADIQGITYKTCAKTLSSAARRLLDGEYVSERRYLEKESTKTHYKEKMRQWWEKNREQMLERQREYNKAYYQQNRDRLLEKSRSQDAINAARLADARKTIDAFRESTSLSPEQFSEMFDIPLKTIKSWYSGKRSLPGWSVKQIMEKLKGQR